jgi:hypothetical protein
MNKMAGIFVLVLLVASTGCGQTGMFAAHNTTTVELSKPNYKVVATGVSGEAKAAYVLGVVISTGQIYKEAMDNLWAQFEQDHGPVVGRRLALANIRYDADTRNLLVYSDVTLSIRADIIEFTD